MTGDNRLPQALAALQAGDAATAAPLFCDILESEPNHPEASYYLGLIRETEGNLAEAAFRMAVSSAAAGADAMVWSKLVDLMVAQQAPIVREEMIDVLVRPPPKLDSVQIEITTDCNLKCGHCQRTIGIEQGTWSNTHIPVERFRTIAESLPPANRMILQGVGEPLLHPRFDELIDVTIALGKFDGIGLNTNILARPVETYLAALARGLTLMVSIDSINQATADLCRKGTKVEKLKSRFVELLRAHPRQITVVMVTSRHNLFDIPETLRWFDGIGQSFQVVINPVIDYRATSGADSISLTPSDIDGLCRSITAQCPHDYISVGICLPSKRCTRPFLSPYITVEGLLTPCCATEDPSHYGNASLLAHSYGEIISTEPARTWLRRYLLEDPDICTNCSFQYRPDQVSG